MLNGTAVRSTYSFFPLFTFFAVGPGLLKKCRRSRIGGNRVSPYWRQWPSDIGLAVETQAAGLFAAKASAGGGWASTGMDGDRVGVVILASGTSSASSSGGVARVSGTG